MADAEGVEPPAEQNGKMPREAEQAPSADTGDMTDTMEEVSLHSEESEHRDEQAPKLHVSHHKNPSTTSAASEAQQPPPPPEKDQIVTPNTPSGHSNLASPIETGRPTRLSTETSNSTQRSAPLSSIVFVVTALEQIASSKEARKKKPLEESANRALAAIKQDNGGPDPEVIFEPLRLATETSSIPLTTTSLDCIGKLISYSYFSIPPLIQDPSTPIQQQQQQQQQVPLIERAIDTICDCFQDEATPAEIQLQIVKSLLAAVLNDKVIVHGSGLLKAVRQVYNIFLLSRSPANQQVAQGTLTQMVGTVFERVNNRLSMKEARLNVSKLDSEQGTANTSQVNLNGSNSAVGSEAGGTNEADAGSEAQSVDAQDLEVSDKPVRKEPREQLTLKSFENTKSFDDAKIGDNAPTMVTHAQPPLPQLRTPSGQPMPSINGDGSQIGPTTLDEDEEDEIYVKDAFLVFRSMCRLSTKTLSPDQQQDTKSSNMRSKLVSLAIIRTLLNNHISVFTSPLVIIRSSSNNEPTSFGQAINQYLRLSLGKNGASSVRQVFECCCEIFWLMVRSMRVMLKVGYFMLSAANVAYEITERDRGFSERNISRHPRAQECTELPETLRHEDTETLVSRSASSGGDILEL